jgi:hypothetical protein
MKALPIYKAFPEADLMGCRKPRKNETCRKYLDDIRGTSGDGLFDFVLAELADLDDEDPDGRRRITRAINDLEAVRENL